MILKRNFNFQKFKAGLWYLWLPALILAPLYFNRSSSRVFESEKHLLLILFLTPAALLFLLLKSRSLFAVRRFNQIERISLPILMLMIYVLCISISLIVSVDFNQSFFGSFYRSNGWLIQAIFVVVCLLIACSDISKRFLNLVFFLIIQTSIPICIYAIFQNLGIDFFAWGAETISRTSSFLGNPVSLASYLLFCIPLTLYCVQVQNKPKMRVLLLFIMIAQLWAFYSAGSRSPFIGLVGFVGFYCIFSLLINNTQLSREISKILLSSLFVLLLVTPCILFYVDLSHFNFSRLNTILLRLELFKSASSLVFDTNLPQLADQSELVNAFRPLFGFGSDSQSLFSNQLFSATMDKYELEGLQPDRAHNLFWDQVIQHGLLGVSVFYLFIGLLFRQVIHGILGSNVSRYYQKYEWALLIAPAVIIFSLYLMGISSGYLPVIGFAAFLLCAVIYLLFLSTNKQSLSLVKENRQVMALLLSVIVGALIDMQFSVVSLTSQLYFWVFIGLLLSTSSSIGKTDDKVDAPSVTSYSSTVKNDNWLLLPTLFLLFQIFIALFLELPTNTSASNQLFLSSIFLFCIAVLLFCVFSSSVIYESLSKNNEQYFSNKSVIQLFTSNLNFIGVLSVCLFTAYWYLSMKGQGDAYYELINYFDSIKTLNLLKIVAMLFLAIYVTYWCGDFSRISNVDSFNIKPTRLVTALSCLLAIGFFFLFAHLSKRELSDVSFSQANYFDQKGDSITCLNRARTAILGDKSEVRYLTKFSHCALSLAKSKLESQPFESLSFNQGYSEADFYRDVSGLSNKQLRDLPAKQLLLYSYFALKQNSLISPNNANHHVNLARFYRHVSKLSFSAKKEYTLQANKAYKKGLELNSQSLILHREVGDFWLAQKQFSQALKLYQQLVGLSPLNEKDQGRLISILIKLRQFDKATKQIQEIDERYLSSGLSLPTDLKLLKAELLIIQKKYHSAIGVHENILSTDPRNISTLKALTALYGLTEQKDKAKNTALLGLKYSGSNSQDKKIFLKIINAM